MYANEAKYVNKDSPIVNLEKVVHGKYLKIDLTRDYKYISHVTRHGVSYDKT